MDVALVNIEDFAECIGDWFRVSVETSDVIELELTSVTRLGDAPAEGMRVPFSLMFHGPAEPILVQQMMQLEHDGLGTCEMFIVPIGPGGSQAAMKYESVFA